MSKEEILGVVPVGEDQNVFQLITTNPKLDYHIVGLPNRQVCATINNEQTEYIDSSLVDYNFPIPDSTLKKWIEVNKVNKLDKEDDIDKIKKAGLPLSFLEIKSVEEGTSWYEAHRPDLPEGLAPLFARYMWGDLKKYNRQQLKLLRKKRDKDVKKKKKEDPHFKIEHGLYNISFA